MGANQPQLPALADKGALLALAESYAGQIMQDEQLGPTLRQLPSIAERAALETALRDCRELFRPVTENRAEAGRAAEAFAGLMAGYPSMRNANAEETTSTYVAFCADLPLFAIQQACHQVSHGKIEGLDPDWPPTAVRMHIIAETIRNKAYAREVLPIEKVLAVKALARPPLNPEQAERGRKLLRGTMKNIEEAEEARLKVVRERSNSGLKEREAEWIKEEWRALGREPPPGERPMSVSLAKSIGAFERQKKLKRERKAAQS